MNYVIVGFLLLKIVTAEEINEKICLAATMCFDGKNTTSEWLDVSPRTGQEKNAELDEIKKDLAILKNENAAMKETVEELNSTTIAHRQELISLKNKNAVLEKTIEELNSTVIVQRHEWSEWEQWTTCSKTCQSGERKRTRICSNGPGCIGNMVDMEICSTQDCPDIANECDDGVTYNGKCYFAIFHRDLGVSYVQSKSICNDAGGTTAGIWNKEHQTSIENYVGAKMPNSDYPNPSTYIWLSMTYDNSKKTMTMPNGNSFPLTTFRWFPIYPDSHTTDATAVGVIVHKDGANTDQGLFNTSPFSNAYGALCVK